MERLTKQTTITSVAIIASQVVDGLLGIPVGSSVAVIGALLQLIFNRQAKNRLDA